MTSEHNLLRKIEHLNGQLELYQSTSLRIESKLLSDTERFSNQMDD